MLPPREPPDVPPARLAAVAVVAVVVLAKLVVEVAGAAPLKPSPLLGDVVAATVFLIGFLLAGTVADYKESERLPGDIAATLDTIADECLIVHANPGSPAAAQGLRMLRDIADGIHEWIHRAATSKRSSRRSGG